MDSKTDYISPSQIKLYLTCGQAYKIRYFDKIKEPERLSTWIGTVVHQIIAEDLKNKIETGLNQEYDVLTLKPIEYINKRFEKSTEFPLINDLSECNIEDFKSKTNHIITKFLSKYNEIRNEIRPLFVEVMHDLTIPVDGFNDQTLKCIADLIEQTTVSDWKTSIVDGHGRSTIKNKLSSKESDCFSDIALTAYALIYYVKFNELPKDIFYRFMCYDIKADGVQYFEIHTERSLKDIEILILQADEILKSRCAAVFPPNGLGTWKCNSNWCFYYDSICKFIKRGIK